MERTLHCGESCGSQRLWSEDGSRTKTFQVSMLKKDISREPDIDGNMVHVDNTDGTTIAVAGVIHQDIDPELGEIPDLDGYRQREGIRDVKLGEELPHNRHVR